MSSNTKNLTWALSAWCLCLCAGCGRSAVEHGEVLGFVTLDGLPVDQAAVFLAPRSQKAGGIAGSVTDGLFEFSGSNGPAPGSYEVILKPIEPDAEDVVAALQARKSQPLEARNKFLTAVKRQGPVIVEVTKNLTNEIEISLTSR